jgi:hypothetical protein
LYPGRVGLCQRDLPVLSSDENHSILMPAASMSRFRCAERRATSCGEPTSAAQTFADADV